MQSRGAEPVAKAARLNTLYYQARIISKGDSFGILLQALTIRVPGLWEDDSKYWTQKCTCFPTLQAMPATSRV
jgi:hypothetical protein